MYHISKETYDTYIIVIKELSQEEHQYMRCLCDRTANPGLLNYVVRSCNEHPDNNVYDEYLSELLYSVRKELYSKNKEGKNMSQTNESLIDENSSLASEISFLRSLLAEIGIAIPVR